ncbi:MAG: hypothetical protein HKN54_10930 [Flavobacteriaceae bacterium]|nr:hypothetical protein [Flavobacteriaceae bacterium]
MRFTRYYSKLIKTQGIPHLDVNQYCRVMNIVSLEGRLQELNDLKKELKHPNEHYKYDVRIHRITQQLKSLTLDQYPKDVIEQMVYSSNG